MEGVLVETENMLAHGRIDLSRSLCFVALRGDDAFLHQLLKRGLDPNEADNTGRSALHVAASKGSQNCVLLLLDYGADPNCKGICRPNTRLKWTKEVVSFGHRYASASNAANVSYGSTIRLSTSGGIC